MRDRSKITDETANPRDLDATASPNQIGRRSFILLVGGTLLSACANRGVDSSSVRATDSNNQNSGTIDDGGVNVNLPTPEGNSDGQSVPSELVKPLDQYSEDELREAIAQGEALPIDQRISVGLHIIGGPLNEGDADDSAAVILDRFISSKSNAYALRDPRVLWSVYSDVESNQYTNARDEILGGVTAINPEFPRYMDLSSAVSGEGVTTHQIMYTQVIDEYRTEGYPNIGQFSLRQDTWLQDSLIRVSTDEGIAFTANSTSF